MAIWFLTKILRVIPLINSIPLITKVIQWGKGQSFQQVVLKLMGIHMEGK